MPRKTHGALNTVTGVVSNGATWEEQIGIEVNGITASSTNMEALGQEPLANGTWSMTFRDCEENSSPLLSLTTSELSFTDGSTATFLSISVESSRLSALVGDYVTDLFYTSTTDKITHWAHGRVTFQNNPS